MRSFQKKPRTSSPAILKAASSNVGRMGTVFSSNDKLLRQVGMVMVYYHLFRLAADEGWSSAITRRKLVIFDNRRDKNREMAERGLASVDYNLLEFDGLSQSPNDAYALKLRVSIIINQAFQQNVQLEDL